MGTIRVEGIPEPIEIQGDTPTPEEEQAIIEELLSRAGQDVEALASGVDVEELPPQFPVGTAANPGEARPVSGMDFMQARVREQISGLSPPAEMAAEMAPSMAGAIGGAKLGAVTGNPMVMILASGLGGLMGEFLAQETGLAPESMTNLALAGGGPAAGIGGAQGFRLARRGVGGVVGLLPPVKTAMKRVAEGESIKEFENVGARIFAQQKGLMSRPSNQLYEAAKRSGATVPAAELKNTIEALKELSEDLITIQSFPAAKQTLALVEDTLKALTSQQEVSFKTIVMLRKVIGGSVQQAERSAGVNFGASPKLFKAMADDIDLIAKGGSRARRPARVSQAASKRAKLEFAVEELEGAVARFTKDVPGEDALALDVSGLQKWFRDVTNPKSAKYNKNFVDAFGGSLDEIRTHLKDLAKIASAARGPAGPGSIVVRGVTSRTGRQLGQATIGAALGAVVGSKTGGDIGAGVGALVGASGPEMMTALFLSPRGQRLLQKAVNLGKAEISAGTWAGLSTFIARSLGEDEGDQSTLISDLQRRAVGVRSNESP